MATFDMTSKDTAGVSSDSIAVNQASRAGTSMRMVEAILDISKITKFKEMFDGRIKTLNPLVYSSLLYNRENEFHKKQFLSLKVPEIDIVIVNLYPFHKYLKRKVINDIIEMIDIGWPSLLRAAGKNFRYITPIMDIKDYKRLINNLKKNNGVTDFSFRKKMAHKIYKGTSGYDKIISDWLDESQK